MLSFIISRFILKMKLTFLFTFLFLNLCVFSQFGPTNGVADSKPERILLKNASVYLPSGEKEANMDILIFNGKIEEIGKNLNVEKGTLVFEAKGKTILPAFVEINSNYGLPKPNEPGFSFRPQLETSKQGAYYWNESIHPETDASLLFKPDSKSSEILVKCGFGFACSHVQDGIVRGNGTLVSLGSLSSNKSMIVPVAGSFYSFAKGVSNQTYPSSQMGAIALLRQALYDFNYYVENQKTIGEKSVSFEKWQALQNQPVFLKTEDKWEVLRAQKIASEFGQNWIYVGSGNEYGIVDELKSKSLSLVIPLHFPEAYDVKDPYIARQIPLSDLKHWEMAPANPAIMEDNQITFALSSNGVQSPEEFWKNLRKSLKNGLSREKALEALTLVPAKMLHAENVLGSLEKGKWASFSVFSGDPFEGEASLLEMWFQGEQQQLKQLPSNDILGQFNLNLDNKKYQLEITGTNEKPQGKVQTIKTTYDKKHRATRDTIAANATVLVVENDITIQFNCNDDNFKGSINLHAKINGEGSVFEGDGMLPDGKWISWSAIRFDRPKDEKQKDKAQADSTKMPKNWFHPLAYGFDATPSQPSDLIKNVTVWTNEAEGRIEGATVVVEKGKIIYVGRGTHPHPSGAKVIDGKGMHLTSGIIDEHSHIAISKGVNEGGQAISAEVSIGDVVNPDDINIYRQLAGGVTAAQLLHGSANPIGGQSALVKLKWGFTADEMLIPNAPKFIKCALGENVKQANWGDFNTVRFPQTRMGVEQVFYDGFQRARKYTEDWKNFQAGNGPKPRKDLELDVLNEILQSQRFITCHSYVQSEINMLMHVADSMHFKINTFTHILEGYKVADKMKEHGVGGSTFADWWAYKFEVNDAIPYNAKMMQDQGVVVAINSDDAEMGRRLNQEAGKCVKYGDMTEEDAWKLVTLNPAKLLHLDDRMGSVKSGKDADLVLWTDNPLSIKAKVRLTMVDGCILFDTETDEHLRERNASDKARIISKMLEAESQGEAVKPFTKKKRRFFHCNTIGEEGSETENEH